MENLRYERVLVELTFYQGGKHCYVSVSYYDNDKNYCSEKIKRPIYKEEIDSDKDRFYAYEEGELIEPFLSWKEALQKAKEYIESNSTINQKKVYVEGVPNNGRMLLSNAIDPNLDTRKKCSICGKVFAPREGFYNFPSGAVCCSCKHKPN